MSFALKRKSAYLRSETAMLMLGSGVLLLTDLVLKTSVVSVAATSVIAAVLVPQLYPGFWGWLSAFYRRYQLPSVLVILALALYLINFFADPASAQFLNGAQNWMQSQFPQGQQVIPLVFNVLRGLFLLYLAISLIGVVQAARQDQDWQTLARTPLIILMTVTLGDVLVGFIIGGGGNP